MRSPALHEYAFMSIAFCIPVNRSLVSVSIIVLLLVFVFGGNLKQRLSGAFSNRWVWIATGLYAMYAAGMIYSQNTVYGFTDLQVKLSILLLPVVTSCFEISRIQLKRILFAFLAGCITSGIFCIASACYDYFILHKNSFLYEAFSFLLHPTYFAMYLCFAICIVFRELFETGKIGKRLRIKFLALLVFFIVLIILLSSKAGLICSGLVLIFSLGRYAALTGMYRQALVYAALFSSVYVLFFGFIIPAGMSRIATSEKILMQGPIENTTVESSSVRIVIWKTGLGLLKENYLFGTGTGDVKDALVKAYHDNGVTHAYERKLNAHNQYLQTFLAIGIAGFVLLICFFAIPFAAATRGKDYLLLMLIAILAFNFLFESMLETQAGVVFTSFFCSLLIVSMRMRQTEAVQQHSY